MRNANPFYAKLGGTNQSHFPQNSTPMWVALNPLTFGLSYEDRERVTTLAPSTTTTRSVRIEIPVITMRYQPGAGHYLIGTEQTRVLPRDLLKFRALVYHAMPGELTELLQQIYR